RRSSSPTRATTCPTRRAPAAPARGPGRASSRRLDERREQRREVLALVPEALGVPLHAQREAAFRRLDALDYRIPAGARRDHETAAQRTHCLMVEAVHGHALAAEDRAQLRAGD